MPRYNPVVLINQDRVVEPKLFYASGDLGDLLVAVGSCVPCVWDQHGDVNLFDVQSDSFRAIGVKKFTVA
jgi:hypothetical protein